MKDNKTKTKRMIKHAYLNLQVYAVIEIDAIDKNGRKSARTFNSMKDFMDFLKEYAPRIPNISRP